MPGVPALINPADGHVIQATSGVPTQIFTWDAGPGATPSFYRLHFENADDPAGFRINVDIPHGGARTSTQQIIPPPLANKRIRWRVQACAGTAGALTVQQSRCGVAAARILTWSTAVPPPQLLAPARGAVGVDVRFRWSTQRGASAYLICVSKPGVACPAQETDNANTRVVRRVGGQNTEATLDLWRFRGQRMNWTAAACGGSGTCAYQTQTRYLDVAALAPLLVLPAGGSRHEQRLVDFRWNAVDWADYYTLCVSRPGVACPAQGLSHTAGENAYTQAPGRRAHRAVPPSNAQTKVFKSFAPGVTADLGELTGSLHWTVAACASRANAFHCRYQPAVRAIERRNPPPPPSWIDVTLTEIHVRDTCDSASPGDWTLQFFASVANERTTLQSDSVNWPAGGSRNVGGGDVVRVGQKIRLHNIPSTARLSFGVSAVDCDADGIWTPFRLFQGTEGIAAIIGDWRATCGGEEVWEASGHNDVVGSAIVGLEAERWRGSNRRLFNARSGPPPGGHAVCARDGFTAHFEITSSQ